MEPQDRDALRQELLARRDSLGRDEIRLRSRLILVKLEVHPLVAEADLVHCYLPWGSEVFTVELIADLLERGRRVAVPVADRDGLRHVVLDDRRLLPTTAAGGAALAGEDLATAKLSEVSVAIAPGVGFSADGGRLGYGRGRYRAFLSSLAVPVLAPAYDFQVTRRFAHAPGEPRIARVVTETAAYDAA